MSRHRIIGSRHEVSTCHAEDRVSWAFWDLPGHTPPWIQVASTPCPGEPSVVDPQIQHWEHAPQFWCQRKHLHIRRTS